MGIDFRPASGLRNPDAYMTPAAMTIGGAARVPSSRPTFVSANINISCTDAQDRTVNLQVETDIGSGVYVTVGTARHNPDVFGLGVGITSQVGIQLNAIVPARFRYRFTQSGSGTATIASQKELTL